MSTVTPPVPLIGRPFAPEREISPRDNGMLMTPEEFDELRNRDEEHCYELINGVLIVSPAPGPSEVDPNEELGCLLRNYSKQHPGIIDKTLFEVTIQLPNSRRRADRAVWVGLGRRPNLQRDIPDIVIEFVSRDHRDRVRDYVTKRVEYLDLGVREYWIMDRFQCILTVLRRTDGQESQQVIPGNAIYRTPLLPGFELPLQELLKLANSWDE